MLQVYLIELTVLAARDDQFSVVARKNQVGLDCHYLVNLEGEGHLGAFQEGVSIDDVDLLVVKD